MPFRDVVAEHGHARLVNLLQRSIRRGTLPPSLIFAGPTGSGARATALAVAQALNCLNLQSTIPNPQSSAIGNPQSAILDLIDACGRCTACVRIARGVHPDVLIVEPGDTGAIKIEQVRDVIDRAAYRPFEGMRRVVIVDDADALMGSAQNALLKTLEEPPPASVFVLVTSRPDMLLATVRSRCIRLWFAASTSEPVSEDALDVAVRVLSHAAANNDASRRIDAAKELLANTGAGGAGDREQLASHLRAIASMLRDVEVLSTRGPGVNVGVLAHPDLRARTERLAGAFGGERGVRAFGAIDRALAALDGNAGVKVVADWVALQL